MTFTPSFHNDSRLAGRLNLVTALFALFTLHTLSTSTDVALAQLPITQLESVHPAGGRPATTVKVTLTGKNIQTANRLVFSHPGITAEPIAKSDANGSNDAGGFAITIATDVPAGTYDVRAIGRFGVSNPRAFVVEDLQQIVLKRDAPNRENHSPEQAVRIHAGSVVSSSSTANQADFYRFYAKAGEALVARCAGTRLDSRIDATLVLYDTGGKELMRVRDSESYDPVMAFTIPADGEYVIEVYDFLYRGGDDFFYRLSLGHQPHIEAIFPPTGTPGDAAEHTVYGYHLPAGKPVAGVKANGPVASPLQEQSVELPLSPADSTYDQRTLNAYVASNASMLDGQTFRLPSPRGKSNAVAIGHAAAPVVVEAEPNSQADQAQTVSLPCEVAGQFQSTGDEDWFTFTAPAGERIWIEAISHRFGGRTDPTFLVQEITKNDQGEDNVKQISNVDDLRVYVNRIPNFETRHRDPSFQFVAKKDATYRVMIRDVYNMTRGDVRSSYRLVIGRGQPDFRLVAHLDPYRKNNAGDLRMPKPVLWKGGTVAMNVHVFRRFGFDGDIHVTAKGLPEGVTCHGAVAGGGAKQVKLIFQVNEEVTTSAAAIQIVGRAKGDEEEIVRHARPAYLMYDTENPERIPPASRLVQQHWLSVQATDNAPCTITPDDHGKLLETCLGGQLAIPFTVTRRDDFKSTIQVVPEGLPRQLRLDQTRTEGDKQTYNLKIKTNNFAAGIYTFYLVGRGSYLYTEPYERVAKPDDSVLDKNKAHTQFAVASSPIRLQVHATPVDLQIASTELTMQAGETHSLETTLERRFGFGGNVTVELAGPKGIRAAAVAVPSDKTTAALEIQVADSVPPGKYQCRVLGQHVFGGLALAAQTKFTLIVQPKTGDASTVAGK